MKLVLVGVLVAATMLTYEVVPQAQRPQPAKPAQPASSAQPAPRAVARPKILGLAHAAFFVSDLAKARVFYKDFLGFDEEPFTLPKPDGSGERIVFIKINDRQFIELFADETKGEGQLNHASVFTDDADRMRDYLASKNIKVPETVGKGKTGNKNFTIKDPDDHTIEIVEYQPDSLTTKDAGKHMPATRMSSHMMHVGLLVGDLDRAMTFYRDLLGFSETWRGSARDSQLLSWVNLRVPDGEDYVEFMLYEKLPPPDQRGVRHHISLTVPDAQKAVEELQKRAATGIYTREIRMQVGVNRKRQVNLFDPDGTRVELMEATTVDGVPAPNSTLPPPKATP